jgi:hypothetical protein
MTLALPMATAALLWMSPAWFLFDALGVPILPVIAGVVAFMLTPLAPFFSDVTSRWRWGVPVTAAAATAACAILAWSAPTFSADRPERLNLTFFQETGGSEARWLASPQSRTLPAAMREAAPFGRELDKPYPWSTAATVFAAPATPIDSAGPELQVLERGTQDGRRLVRARLLSPRGARVVVLVIPADRVASLRMKGQEVPQRTTQEEQRAALVRGPAPRMRSYACLTVPPEGLEVEIAIAGDDPVEGYLLDQSAGLPVGGEALQHARPKEATPIGSGDTTVVARRVAM